MHDVTFLLKTFERPKCLSRCLRSIYEHHADASVVVVEDSFTPYARELVSSRFAGRSVTVFVLPPDQGISAGRNYGIERIQTPYFVLLDDDHVLRPDSNIQRMRDALVDGNWDVMGGTYVQYDQRNRPFFWFWEGELLRIDTLLLCRLLKRDAKVTGCDIVNNFFVAKTESVRAMGGWDPSLKILEHIDFFLRAKQHGLRVAHFPGTLIDHRIVRGERYQKYRVDRAPKFRRQWMEKHGLSHLITFDGRMFRLPHLWTSNCRPVGF